PVESFHLHPLLIAAFAERLCTAHTEPDEHIVFTAHSLPVKVVESGDPYAEEIAATARAVAGRAGVARDERAYQSAGRTPEPWIGPDLGTVIEQLTRAGTKRVLIVPIGFVSDHTEILFDIDLQAAQIARDHGLSLRRTES